MRIVVSDTSPINYLILIGWVDLLPRFFNEIYIPPTVFTELQASEAPPEVRKWAEKIPGWLSIRESKNKLANLGFHSGEAEAIALAEELRADYLNG